MSAKIKPDPFAVLRIRDFVSFSFSRFFLTLGIQIQSITVGWQIYDITKDPLALGLIGLSEIIPFITIVLFAGHLADILNRKWIIALSIIVYLICASALLYYTVDPSILKDFGVAPIYFTIFITGIARAFMSPSFFAFLAQLIPKELFGNASTWNSTVWQIGLVSGPALGGIIYGFYGITAAYTAALVAVCLGLIAILIIPARPMTVNPKKEPIFSSIATGIRFVFKNQIMLAAISLDLFAVLFGGAVALLPVFVDVVLHEGPEVLGLLRASPGLGAVLMSVVLAFFPPLKKAGRNLLLSVGGFGLSIITFALSENLYLSAFALFLGGAFDNVSVVIRHTIVQTMTPNEMRGRVSAVNSIFIGSSNEIGEFESGLMARIMGLVPSVIFGGSMTILVVLSTFKLAPKLRKLDLTNT